ncbi:MAG TPA: NAD(P)H-dependent oxidoreductase [Gammaproteobacteria bacterium]|jgi:FMN-dependent NADH-azoreductase
MKLLHIDSSARAHSLSLAISTGFVEVWKRAYPLGEVIERDLARGPVPAVTDEFVGAMYTPADQRTPMQHMELGLSDQLIAELKAADVILIGSPMYNFHISAPLKGWIDMVVRAGETVDFTQRPPQGLLQGKKAIVVTSRGGSYAAGTPTAAFDFQEPYLRHILSLMGLQDLTFIHVDRQSHGEDIAHQSRLAATRRIEDLVEGLALAAA